MEALTAYADHKQLHVTETREQAIRGLVERWKADSGIQRPNDVLLLALLNAEVRAINRQCQEEKHRAGDLHEEKLSAAGTISMSTTARRSPKRPEARRRKRALWARWSASTTRKPPSGRG